MSDVIPFNFDGAEIRTVVLGGDPHFIGKDVAEPLGYANPTDAMNRHCKGVVKRYPLLTAGGMQELRVLSEPDVLRLIVGSKLPAAERFERWVFEEVLPTLRRTGTYTMPANEPAPGTISPKPFDEWSLEERRVHLSEVNACRHVMNQASAAWLWGRLGFPIPPRHLLPAWWQADLDLRGAPPGNSVTIVMPTAEGRH